MEFTRTGGPVCPHPRDVDRRHSSDGMHLLHWFAGMAMQGELASQGDDGQWLCRDATDITNLANKAYSIAEAMVARGQSTQPITGGTDA